MFLAKEPPHQVLSQSKWTPDIYQEFTNDLHSHHHQFYDDTRDNWDTLPDTDKHHRLTAILSHMQHTRDFLARKHNTFHYPNKFLSNLLLSPSPSPAALAKHKEILGNRYSTLNKKHARAFYKGSTSFLPSAKIPCTASTRLAS